MIVEGRAESTVVIDRLEVNVWRRAGPVEGTLVRCLVGGAALQPRELGVRLDDERPQAAYFREGRQRERHERELHVQARDDGGEPFKTTGISRAKRVFDSIGDGQWQRGNG